MPPLKPKNTQPPRRAAGKNTRRWRNADELFRWWMEDENLEGQLDLFGGEVGKVDS